MFLVICVNYNNDEETFNFITALLRLNNFDRGKIVLVNNGNLLNPSLTNLCINQSRIKLYQAEKNLGYLGGACWGLKQYLKEFPMPKWIILSNTDIHFSDSDIFKKIELYDPPPDIIAPEIILQSNSRQALIKQNPHLKKRPSKLRMLFYKSVFRFFLLGTIYYFLSEIKCFICLNFLKKRKSFAEANKSIKCERIYAPMGAFIILNKSYFNAGGTLNHGCFLYGEEISIAENAQKLNLNVIYDPNLKVLHKGGNTTRLVANRKLLKYHRDAAAYCYRLLYKNNK